MTRPPIRRKQAWHLAAGDVALIGGRYRTITAAGATAPGERPRLVLLVTEDGRGAALGRGEILRTRPTERAPAHDPRH